MFLKYVSWVLIPIVEEFGLKNGWYACALKWRWTSRIGIIIALSPKAKRKARISHSDAKYEAFELIRSVKFQLIFVRMRTQ